MWFLPARSSKQKTTGVVNMEGRPHDMPIHELLPVAEGTGFCSLPGPSRLDMFVDLEGDPFAPDGGRQYLFGLVTADEEGELQYEKRWCFTAEEEKQVF